jgi:hypothetical protein
VAVRGPHHRDVAPDAVESDSAVRPKAFDLPLAFQLHAELGEERDSGIQVFDDDGDVVHPLNGHVCEHKTACKSVSLTATICGCRSASADGRAPDPPWRRSGWVARQLRDGKMPFRAMQKFTAR